MSILESEVLCHSCNIEQRIQKLPFTQGSLEFQVGDIVKNSYNATARVVGVTLLSGVWDGTAEGYLDITDAMSRFSDNDVITSEHGSARVGVTENVLVNKNKEPLYSWKIVEENVPCMFSYSGLTSNPEDDKHQYKWEASPALLTIYLPPTVYVQRYSTRITSNTPGFTDKFGVVDVRYHYSIDELHHIEALVSRGIA